MTLEPRNHMTTWQEDKLNSKSIAEFLTQYLTGKYAVTRDGGPHSSFVLNVNAEWGFGKTYLLQNWSSDLTATNYPTIYFNAWASDFSNNPLIAFIAEIEKQLTPFFAKSKSRAYLEKVVSQGKALVRPAFPVILGILAKKLTGLTTQELKELLEIEAEDTLDSPPDPDSIEKSISTVVSKAAEGVLKEHRDHEKRILDFKAQLGKLIQNVAKNQPAVKLPLFIFVDELDRCRPLYAIDLLENIKHIFGIDGVYFVVATDTTQLGHSIRAVYGGSFESERYLKRFFDQEYTLPQPDNLHFAAYLFAKYGLDREPKLFSPLRESDYPGKNPSIVLFGTFSTFFRLSLRDQEQCCAVLDAVRLTTRDKRLHLGFLLFLVMIRQKWRDLFDSYVRTLDFKHIAPHLRERAETKVDFASLRVTTKPFQPHDPIRVPVLDLIAHYAHLATSKSKDVADGREATAMYEQIRTVVIREPGSTASSGLFDYYIELVRQAGRIT